MPYLQMNDPSKTANSIMTTKRIEIFTEYFIAGLNRNNLISSFNRPNLKINSLFLKISLIPIYNPKRARKIPIAKTP